MDAKKVIERIKNKKTVDGEWLEIREDILKFLQEEHPEEEKRLVRPFGYLEIVTMMCDGIGRIDSKQ